MTIIIIIIIGVTLGIFKFVCEHVFLQCFGKLLQCLASQGECDGWLEYDVWYLPTAVCF